MNLWCFSGFSALYQWLGISLDQPNREPGDWPLVATGPPTVKNLLRSLRFRAQCEEDSFGQPDVLACLTHVDVTVSKQGKRVHHT